MENKEEYFIYIKSEILKMNTKYSNLYLININTMDSKDYDERLVNNIINMLNELYNSKLPYRKEYNKYIQPFIKK